MLFHFFPRGHCQRQTSIISISLPPFWCFSISLDNSIFSQDQEMELSRKTWCKDLAVHLLRQVRNKWRKTRQWHWKIICYTDTHFTEGKIYHFPFQQKGLNILWNEYIKAQLDTCNLFIWRISCNDFTWEIGHWLLHFLNEFKLHLTTKPNGRAKGKWLGYFKLNTGNNKIMLK